MCVLGEKESPLCDIGLHWDLSVEMVFISLQVISFVWHHSLAHLFLFASHFSSFFAVRRRSSPLAVLCSVLADRHRHLTLCHFVFQVPTKEVIILNGEGQRLDKIAGPFNENSDETYSLICEALGESRSRRIRVSRAHIASVESFRSVQFGSVRFCSVIDAADSSTLALVRFCHCSRHTLCCVPHCFPSGASARFASKACSAVHCFDCLPLTLGEDNEKERDAIWGCEAHARDRRAYRWASAGGKAAEGS